MKAPGFAASPRNRGWVPEEMSREISKGKSSQKTTQKLMVFPQLTSEVKEHLFPHSLLGGREKCHKPHPSKAGVSKDVQPVI